MIKCPLRNGCINKHAPRLSQGHRAITLYVCSCMNMTFFCVSGSNGRMKDERNQSRKSGRLAEKRGYRMRDDAIAKWQTPRHVMKMQGQRHFFPGAAGFPGGQSEGLRKQDGVKERLTVAGSVMEKAEPTVPGEEAAFWERKAKNGRRAAGANCLSRHHTVELLVAFFAVQHDGATGFHLQIDSSSRRTSKPLQGFEIEQVVDRRELIPCGKSSVAAPAKTEVVLAIIEVVMRLVDSMIGPCSRGNGGSCVIPSALTPEGERSDVIKSYDASVRLTLAPAQPCIHPDFPSIPSIPHPPIHATLPA
ncbi:hypothetical protein KCU62_g452, partial [Aureobasidium sp. EXF-3399]